jgi:hypothetical protein
VGHLKAQRVAPLPIIEGGVLRSELLTKLCAERDTYQVQVPGQAWVVLIVIAIPRVDRVAPRSSEGHRAYQAQVLCSGGANVAMTCFKLDWQTHNYSICHF